MFKSVETEPFWVIELWAAQSLLKGIDDHVMNSALCRMSTGNFVSLPLPLLKKSVLLFLADPLLRISF